LPGIDASIGGGFQPSAKPDPEGSAPVSTSRKQPPVIRLTGETRTKFSAMLRIAASPPASTPHTSSAASDTRGSGEMCTDRARRQPVSGIVPEAIAGRRASHAHSRTPGIVAR
jgi:hypothetical protein